VIVGGSYHSPILALSESSMEEEQIG